jgi:hypothetical protein
MESSARTVTGSQAAIAKAHATVAQRVVLLTVIYVFMLSYFHFASVSGPTIHISYYTDQLEIPQLIGWNWWLFDVDLRRN